MPCSRTSCAMVRSLEEPEPALVRRSCRQKPMPLAARFAEGSTDGGCSFLERGRYFLQAGAAALPVRVHVHAQGTVLDGRACLSAPVSLQGWHSRRTRTCCGMPAGSPWSTKGRIPGRCRPTWATRTSSTPCATPSLWPRGSRICGDEQQSHGPRKFRFSPTQRDGDRTVRSDGTRLRSRRNPLGRSSITQAASALSWVRRCA